MAESDQASSAKAPQARAAEDFPDQVLFLLGEAVYASRIQDAALAAFPPRPDAAA